LHDDAEQARHLRQLILNSTETPEGSVYEVSGDMDLMPTGVM
jgi:hypothetical protein